MHVVVVAMLKAVEGDQWLMIVDVADVVDGHEQCT